MRDLKVALRALRRDWSGGELGVLALALVVSVASVASVGFFTDRIQTVMDRQAAELLAADLVVLSSEPVGSAIRARAEQAGLDTGDSWTFRSVVLAGDQTQLTEVKAVSGGYPLRGQLRTAPELFAAERIEPTGPPAGEVWVESGLLQTLGIEVGAGLQVGAQAFPITRVLTYEPDRGGEVFNIAPRLLMNLSDVPATELVQPGSRVRYRLMVAGESDAVQAFRASVDGVLSQSEQLQGLDDARPELRVALDRARQFLGLAAMVSVVVAGVAIALAARRFARRHWDAVAIMRCFGATQDRVMRLYLLEMLLLGLMAGLVGVVIGYVAQSVLAGVLGNLVQGSLPSPSMRPALPALVVGLLTLLGFGLPPILRLRTVSPARVLRKDVGGWRDGSVWLYLLAVGLVSALMVWQAQDLKLAGIVLGGAAATLVLLTAVAWLMVRLMRRLRGRVGIAWRFGLANIARRQGSSVVQVVALGLGIMVLLALGLVRSDLLASWQNSVPEDAPNHFLINIQPEEVEPLRVFLAERGAPSEGLYPMIRGRLTTLDGVPVDPDSYDNPRAERLAQREWNLSWAAEPQSDNKVVDGSWWDASAPAEPQISLETGIAEALGIGLGDRMQFMIAGSPIEVPVTSLRTVNWDTFRPNFFAVLPPGSLDDFPATWITSFYLPKSETATLVDLVRNFPAVTVIDVDAVMAKVREIIDRVVTAVEYVFVFTLVAGLVVLYAAVQATRDERLFEGAVLRTLGGRRKVVVRSLLAEFATLGALAGLLAAFGASLLGYGLGEHLFGFGYRFDPLLWLLGTALGAGGVGLAGWLVTRTVLDSPPALVLRREG